MKNKILTYLPAECPWRDTLHWFDTIDSTNTAAKKLAESGAPHGTVLVAGHQIAGRGRMGRNFSSPADMGIYLSVILRPNCAAGELMHLTCATAVAMCDAVEAVTGLRPGVKWINDLIFGNKKLGGILTELSVDPKSGTVTYAVIGVGINCNQSTEEFPPELRDIAISLKTATGVAPDRFELAAAMIHALHRSDSVLQTKKEAIMAQYQKDCVTIGRDVRVLRGDLARCGTAVGIDPEGALLVSFPDGTTEAVSSGEVSVRGMYGYI